MIFILSVSFTMLVSLGIPVGALVYSIVKKPRRIVPYLLGVFTFLVFQFLTRLPLLQLLSTQMWFVLFKSSNPVVYSIVLGFSAGLFEEGGRFIVMKLCMKNRLSVYDGIAHGLGHGGFEAATIVGLSYIILLFTNPGVLYTAGSTAILFAGIERLAAMSFHVGCSVLVLHGIHRKRWWYTLIALLLHTALDAPLGIFMVFKWSTLMIEGYIVLWGLAMLAYVLMVVRREGAQNTTLSTERMVVPDENI